MTTQKDNTIASNKTIQNSRIGNIPQKCIDDMPHCPIGIEPYYITDEQRMIELSNAISRYLAYATKNINRKEAEDAYKQIAKWAYELKLRAEAEVKLIEEGE